MRRFRKASKGTDVIQTQRIATRSVALCIVVTGIIVIGLFVSMSRSSENLRYAEVRYGQGKVVGVTSTSSTYGGQPINASINVKLNGEVYQLSSDKGFNGLVPGADVDVAYNVGKSGQVYLREVWPSVGRQ